jgi:hypothetical protein
MQLNAKNSGILIIAASFYVEAQAGIVKMDILLDPSIDNQLNNLLIIKPTGECSNK